jgi:hypothetical protein
MKNSAPAHSAEIQHHGVIDGYPLVAKIVHHLSKPPSRIANFQYKWAINSEPSVTRQSSAAQGAVR